MRYGDWSWCLLQQRMKLKGAVFLAMSFLYTDNIGRDNGADC